MPENAAMTMLEFADVSFSYGLHGFMEQLSFSVAKGELVGLMGPNGAGKSTILKLAAGLLSPQRGEVRVGRRTIRTYGGNERAKLVAYLPQTLDAQVPFRVAELVGMGAYPRGDDTALTVDEALHLTGLEGKAGVHLAELSGGEQRRAYIAMTLVQGARLLLLDEPLASLDIRYQFDLYRLLKDIARKQEVSVCLSLHDIGMGAMLDRLLLLKHGRMIARGAPGTVLTDQIVRDAFDLDDAAGTYTATHRAVGRVVTPRIS